MKAARIPTKASAATPPIYQLHIELRDLKPAIWQSVLVPQSVTLAKLHQVIQIAMGWTNSHPGGHLKFLHLWPGQIPPGATAGA